MKNVKILIFIAATFILQNCTTASNFTMKPDQTGLSVSGREYEQRNSWVNIVSLRPGFNRSKYIEIGIVLVSGSEDEVELLDMLKKRTASLGGDAIYGITMGNKTMSATVMRMKDMETPQEQDRSNKQY